MPDDGKTSKQAFPVLTRLIEEATHPGDASTLTTWLSDIRMRLEAVRTDTGSTRVVESADRIEHAFETAAAFVQAAAAETLTDELGLRAWRGTRRG